MEKDTDRPGKYEGESERDNGVVFVGEEESRIVDTGGGLHPEEETKLSESKLSPIPQKSINKNVD